MRKIFNKLNKAAGDRRRETIVAGCSNLGENCGVRKKIATIYVLFGLEYIFFKFDVPQTLFFFKKIVCGQRHEDRAGGEGLLHQTALRLRSGEFFEIFFKKNATFVSNKFDGKLFFPAQTNSGLFTTVVVRPRWKKCG